MRTHKTLVGAMLVAGFLLVGCAALDSGASGEKWDKDSRIPKPSVALPKIPDRTFRITDYGAIPDGTTPNTRAIASAIAACEKAGGGKVIVPVGTWLTGPIVLVSNMELHLEDGATLKFSDKPEDYPVGGFAPLPERHQSLITIVNGHDVAITGKGKMDGQGKKWWDYVNGPDPDQPDRPLRKKPGFTERRPKGIVFDKSKRCRVEGITMFNFPMFHMSPTQAEDVTVEGVSVFAPPESPNTDSCNPSGWNIWVNNCHFDTGDDNIAVKPFVRHEDGRPSVENLWITNCLFRNGHGLSVGGQTPGGLRNMYVKNITFEGTDIGLRLKSERGFGGLVENVIYEDIKMKNVGQAIHINSYYHGLPKPGEKHEVKPVDKLTPIWRNIHIKNLVAHDGKEGGILMGLPEMPIEGVVLENVDISAAKPMRIGYAHDLDFSRNVRIEIKEGPPVLIEQDVTGVGVPGLK